jgi:hypothetical protein
MVEIKSTLNGEVGKIDPNKAYMVDFSKLQSVNDLVVILSGLGITFPGNHPIIPHIKQFLNTENPIDNTFNVVNPTPTKEKKAEFIPLKKDNLEDRIFKGE